MDHGLIGHLYNGIAGKRNDEVAAVEMQILLAKERSIEEKNWARIFEAMPRVLGYHKNIAELK